MARVSLNACKLELPRTIINRIHIIFHFIAILSLLYYRALNIFSNDKSVPIFLWGLMAIAEIMFTFLWIFTQAFRWRPVARTVFPENLPADAELPGVDVFICTADPTKEPTIEVMNTVLSAMALDYPSDKLSVYLSDDGGAASTLCAIKEACLFAKSWLPFCREYDIKTRCPEAYFSKFGDDERVLRSDDFKADEAKIKSAYEVFKMNVEKAASEGSAVHDRSAYVEVIHDDNSKDRKSDDNNKMPLLVYVAREKRPTRPHRFKAGALNALLRVSGIMSNAPYIIVLDCDMYCNDPASARQAMCFHLDPQMSRDLSYVQYPQIFYNVSQNDIYDGQARAAYKTRYQGMDGQRGTVCAGTGYYLNKKALYCSPSQEDKILYEADVKFGSSMEFLASLISSTNVDTFEMKKLSKAVIEEAETLASCDYEKGTQWGKEIGYSYDCLLESTFTGYRLHNKGWRSVYLYPKRPCFLGCTTIDMKDALVQLIKWSSGLLQVGLSKFSPMTYGLSNMTVLQSLCYGYFTFMPLFSVPCLIYGIISPLCFLTGIPLFPEVSSSWFAVFAGVYMSSLIQHLYEVVSSGSSIRTWWNEQRIFLIKSVTALLFGSLDVLMKWLGITKASFRLTNKAVDQEKLEKYMKGKFDFSGAKMFMIPLTLLVILNTLCFIGGMKRVITMRNWGEMFGQAFLCSFILVLSLPILQGLIPKRNK
ncbi:cellulose synthase-like protein G1 [Apium graveolens]|uniref:cellulose synthase-like protein G1 n=1 Tax=Apium graveolens TaxID=4045 RepID=UPI003D7A1254